MKLRRALLLAPLLLLLWAGIASAQVPGPGGGYPPTILPTSAVSVTTLPPGTTIAPPEVEGEGEVKAAGQGGQGGQGLARTGSNNVVPLIQAGIVLLGAGTLLVLVARRRRTVRRAAASATA